jgi:hypothetical protein
MILDTYTTVFVWVGSQANDAEKTEAMAVSSTRLDQRHGGIGPRVDHELLSHRWRSGTSTRRRRRTGATRPRPWCAWRRGPSRPSSRSTSWAGTPRWPRATSSSTPTRRGSSPSRYGTILSGGSSARQGHAWAAPDGGLCCPAAAVVRVERAVVALRHLPGGPPQDAARRRLAARHATAGEADGGSLLRAMTALERKTNEPVKRSLYAR